ncbi:hypothetical protein TKK_0018907 [Trichogramma kaykai]
MDSSKKSRVFSATRDERTLQIFLLTQLEALDIEDESIKVEMHEGVMYVCTESGKRHEVKELTEETRRVVEAYVQDNTEDIKTKSPPMLEDTQKNNSAPLPVQTTSATGQMGDPMDRSPESNAVHNDKANEKEKSTEAENGAGGGEKADDNQTKMLDGTMLEMITSLDKRVAGKSTPTVKESVAYLNPKFLLQQNSGLEDQIKGVRNLTDTDLENSNKRVTYQLEVNQRMKKLEADVKRKMDEKSTKNQQKR